MFLTVVLVEEELDLLASEVGDQAEHVSGDILEVWVVQGVVLDVELLLGGEEHRLGGKGLNRLGEGEAITLTNEVNHISVPPASKTMTFVLRVIDCE